MFKMTGRHFLDKMDNVVKRNVPNKTFISNPKKPLWMNRYITRLRRKKTRLYKTMKTTQSDIDVNAYKNVAKETKYAIRRAKRKIEVKISKQSGNDRFKEI